MVGNDVTEQPSAVSRRPAESTPCTAEPTERTSAQRVGAADQNARIGRHTPMQMRPVGRVLRRRVFVVTLLVMGLFGAKIVNYRDLIPNWLTVSQPDRSPAPAAVVGAPLPTTDWALPKLRACRHFADNYGTLPAQLRATPPGQAQAAEPLPAENLAAIADDLAETLRFDIGSMHQDRPWPTWLTVFNAYIAALHASAFVVANPASSQSVRAGIAELYHQALTPVLEVCYVAP